jgi:hypothetical protein
MECQITFAGIPALVRSGDKGRAVLVSPGGGTHAASHAPSLSAWAGYVGPASDDADASIATALGQVMVWSLAGCRVRFWPDSQAPHAPLTDNVKHIPAVDDLMKGCGTFDPRILSELGADRRAAAIAVLETGRLRDGDVDDRKLWKFETPDGATAQENGEPLTRLIAESIEYEVSVGHHLLVDILSVHDGRRRRVFLRNPNAFEIKSLGLGASDTAFGLLRTEGVRAWFSTLPVVSEDLGEGDALPHFAAHYDMLTSPPPIGRRFIPRLIEPGAGEGYRCRSAAILEAPHDVDLTMAAGGSHHSPGSHNHG